MLLQNSTKPASFDHNSYLLATALRIVFDYVNIENNQDYIDIGEGAFPTTGRLLTNGR